MDCFISYSQHDVDVAALLEERLAAKGVRVFLAEKSIPLGENWPQVIRSAVRRCEVVVLLDSFQSRESPWVQQEAGMALASGSLIIPVSLDGQLDKLPGWLAGIQSIRAVRGDSLTESIGLVAECACNRIGASWAALPSELHQPRTVGSAVLRTVLMDQFSGPAERVGAWSRQYGRYLEIYYDKSVVRSTVSQGASLTFTGMVAERLSAFASSSSGIIVESVDAALGRAAAFVLSSQDQQQGGFGRLSSDHGARGGRPLILDLRHTCWAIRALLSIDRKKFVPQIEYGLRWLAGQAQNRRDADRWCWTTAPLLCLMSDLRLLNMDDWQNKCVSLKQILQTDLEESFDPRWASWVKGEKEEDSKGWVSVDNALYVLYCLKDCEHLSDVLKEQRRAAIERLWSRCWTSTEGEPARGLPLFVSNEPEVGPTAQLLEIMSRTERTDDCAKLANFVATRLADRRTMPQTFSWHLSAILSVPGWRDRSLPEVIER